MKRTLTFTPAVIVAALSLLALPAAAQEHHGGGGSGGGGHVASAPRTGGGGQARQSAPRSSSSAPQARSAQGGRTYSTPQGRTYAAPRTLPRESQGGSSVGGQAVPRTSGNGTYRGGSAAGSYGMQGNRYGMNRSYATSGIRGGYRPTMVRPYFSQSYVRPYGWRPDHPFRFVRPYYVFSPWLSLGFGIWVGYPVPYPWVYLGDYQPTVFGDYPDDNYQVEPTPAPAQSNYGGVSFDMQPPDANLFVDGQYIGVVSGFGPNSEPLTLEPGPHKIAIQHEGYRPLEWDVTIVAGQVIPYKGALDRQ